MQRTLPSGLILRTLSEGVASDRERLPAFYAEVNGENDPPHIREALLHWTRDLMERHPTTTLDDIFVVVDPEHDDRIASATLLIPQVWRYEGIDIPVGRPELVGTLPEYRRRGLVRELMVEIHARSAALGHLMQGITGIPHYYRQFGYAMALELEQPLFFPLVLLKEPKADATPAFRLRPATLEDLPDLMRWYEERIAEVGVSDARSEVIWRYLLEGVSPGSLHKVNYLVMEGKSGSVGYVGLVQTLFEEHTVECTEWVVGAESSYAETFDDIMHAIRAWSAERFGTPCAMLYFFQSTAPPVRRMVERFNGGSARNITYRWYLRVPDPIAFFRHIAPVLERRLEGSGANRYTGTLKIGAYDLTGIQLTFEAGKLTDVSTMEGKDGYDISFPWLMLWNVVFGDHAWEEMRPLLPEVYADGRTAVLVEALFPKRPSWVRGLG